MEKEELLTTEVKQVKQLSPIQQAFNDKWTIALKYSSSSLVPDNFKSKPENVIIAMGMAEKMNLDLFTVMQNLNIVKGKAGWGGSFCRTLIELTGKFEDLDLVYVGEKGKDNFGCYLQAKRKKDEKIIKGTTVDMAMVKAERWDVNSKWKSMTEQMLGYRATAFFARLHCPEALHGVYTTEELEDINSQNKVTEVEDVL